MSSHPLARRYVAWLKRRTIAVIVVHLAVFAGAIDLIAFHLPLFADFSYLLPQDAPAVRDLRRLEARVKANDTALAIVSAPSPEARAAAVRELAESMRVLPPELVERVIDDDSDTRAFFKARRHLFVPLSDLQTAADALERRIQGAKLAANPLFIQLDDDQAPDAERDKQKLEELRAKRREAEAKLDKSTSISADGRVAMIQIRTSFRSTDAGRGEQLLALLDTARAKVLAAHPGVEIGFTGGVVTAVAEHNAISKGMVMSSLITTLLVGLVLALYFRSARMLILLIGTLVIATAASFGAAALTVGHLNAATAFLGAIIAGNGVNYGILLIARYLEERGHHDGAVEDAMAIAIQGTLQPTAVASLGASIAYGSLAATSFKGFADFAVIGAVGMVLCWIATYVLLPVLVMRWARGVRVDARPSLMGAIVVRVFGFRRPRTVCVIALVASLVATGLVARYVMNDPFEYDIKRLRSEGGDAVVARTWMGVSDKNFGRGYAGRTYVAADRLEQVPLIVEALRSYDAHVAPEKQTIGTVTSMLDFVPPDQPKKLEVLARIRTLLDDDALAALTEDERAELKELRPPDALGIITPEGLPPMVRDALEEKDGRIGYIVAVRPAPRLNEWDGRDLIRFATAVRTIKLTDGETVTTSGASVIFADIVRSISGDGPRVTGIAALGLILMVVLIVGRNRRAVAVLVATAAGSLLMIAVCAIFELKVNFLDFVALPITLGIGVDYAINIAHRADHETDPITTLRTSGAAVFVCSMTTMIGYGSLLISDNLAIRGFGEASLIGEVACVTTALVLVPAMIALRQRPAAAQADASAAA